MKHQEHLIMFPVVLSQAFFVAHEKEQVMSKELQQAVKERQVWLMKRKEVLKTLSVSSATLHRGMNEGRFPKAYSLGDGSTRVAWKSNEIQDYIDSLAHSEPVPVAPGCQGRKALLPKVRV